MLTRKERIEFLLSHYSDVVAGVRDGGSGGEQGLPLMCRIWNAPPLGYPELERLRLLMKADAPVLYEAVTATFVYPRFVRRAVCPKCTTVKPPELGG